MFAFMVEHSSLNRLPHRSKKMPSYRSTDRFSEGGVEPSVEDLLADPVTEAIMKRDGVSVSSLRSIIETARETLRAREAQI